MIHIREEGQPIQSGLNVYPWAARYSSIGCILRAFGRNWQLRYSPRVRRLYIGSIVMFATVLAGCQTTIVKKEIVTVDKPVPFIPVPPNVPKCTLRVDQLIDEDRKDPGKVGQAYKYDMLCLRQRDKIVEMILDQYRAGSQNFDQINKEIDDLFDRINQSENKESDESVADTP